MAKVELGSGKEINVWVAQKDYSILMECRNSIISVDKNIGVHKDFSFHKQNPGG
jgi:hypothetical protein